MDAFLQQNGSSLQQQDGNALELQGPSAVITVPLLSVGAAAHAPTVTALLDIVQPPLITSGLQAHAPTVALTLHMQHVGPAATTYAPSFTSEVGSGALGPSAVAHPPSLTQQLELGAPPSSTSVYTPGVALAVIFGAPPSGTQLYAPIVLTPDALWPIELLAISSTTVLHALHIAHDQKAERGATRVEIGPERTIAFIQDSRTVSVRE